MNSLARLFGSFVLIGVVAMVSGCSPAQDSAPAPEAQPAQAAPESEPTEAAPAPEPEPAAATPKPAAMAPADGVHIGALVLDAKPDDPVNVQTKEGSAIVKGSFTLGPDVFFQASVLGASDLTRDFGEDESIRALTQEWYDGIEYLLADPGEIHDESATAAPEDGAPAPQPDTPVEEEPNDELKRLESDGVTGYYATGVYNDPPADTGRYIVNGYFRVGGGVVMMGGVHNDRSGEAEKQILDIIRSATWNAEAAAQ